MAKGTASNALSKDQVTLFSVLYNYFAAEKKNKTAEALLSETGLVIKDLPLYNTPSFGL